ncbi:MinD/ParA family protein [Labedella populi]|uniref:MinD/ParA family protein n=2 Tax=Labedella populi TaxID=2498850 RepID=A0A444QC41_9MICO|nr:MinD/ParA family protein [Labedella populi]
MSTFSIVPQTTSARIDEDLVEDDEVVAAEVRPEDTPSAALDEVRAPVTDPGQEAPIVVATVDPSSGPLGAAASPAEDAKPTGAEQRPSREKAPARKAPAPKERTPRTPASKAPARKPPASAAPAPDAPAANSPARKTPARKTPARKAPARKTPARKTPARATDPSVLVPTTPKEAPEPRLTIASATIAVALPPAEQQDVPAEELAVAIEDAPVTPEGLEPRTNSVAVVAEPERAADRDEALEEPPSAAAFTGMSAARALAGAPESSAMLTAERLLEDRRDTRRVPEGFWQKLLYDLSGRRIRVSDSRAARDRRALTARIAKPLVGSARFVPVLTRKGGVGKTTVTTLLGMALADARDDRVIAIDANPDRGTLAERIARRSDHTVRDLVRGADAVTGYTEFSRLVSRDETRLDVLASDTDPHLSQAFDEGDYDVVARLASQYYSIVLTDCGTGIVHSVMGATLRHADAIVVVSGTSVDEARSAAETISWLEANGYPDLAASAVVIINSTAPGTPAVRLDEIEKHFESRVRSIVRIPFDPQLATGAAISFADLRSETRQAARELSALVVEGLPARRRVRESADG